MESVPRTAVKSISRLSLPVSQSLAVRRAASITPPVAPKITAAPVSSPSGESNSSSGREVNLRPARSIILASSRVVIAMSTSGYPDALWSSLPISNFFAVQGMTDTETISFGSIPAFSA
ncbi:unknown [Candidatus Colimorpha enterica]|uniref:Uncharacterized protein n=1 Tax=Candidatus Colimorpha enterica TaxID=3083063 RepID=R6TR83_9BACT|nr:unknown [Candidatus Colimorpha enterica]